MGNPIEFPGLGLGPFDPDPTIFSIGGWDIQWYGLIIAVGFLLAAAYGVSRAPRVGLEGDDIYDALMFCVPMGFIGARAYYVIFNWWLFEDDPVRIFYIREGGMAVYGSVIASVLTAVVVARVKRISILALLDLAAAGFFIGQCIGRWGNFINREAFGSATSLPWRMRIYSMDVHPTFLYESLWTAAGFVMLHILLTRRKYDGQLAVVYLAWYGLGRGLIEGLRTDSLYLFDTGLRVSQVLAFASCAAGVVMLVWFRLRPPRRELYAQRVKLSDPVSGSETEAETNPESESSPESGI